MPTASATRSKAVTRSWRRSRYYEARIARASAMNAHTLFIAPIGLLPVLLYLVLLLQLDSYKLVSLGEILEALLAGAVLAAVSYFVNGRAISALHYSFHTYSNFVAPFAEESLKAAFMLFMFARNRVGFMIDAAIVGFGVGAGFAVAENIYY